MSSKIALITGANGSLGRDVVKIFSDHQYSVINIDRNEADLTQASSVNELRDRLVKENQQPDVIVHCAGGFRFTSIEGMSDADFDFLVNLNLKSSFYLARAFVPVMKQKNFGRMVFVSARATQGATSGMGPYTATKAGINMLVGALADEVRDYDINVNAVLPSIIDTPPNRKDMPDVDPKKWVGTEQLAQIILILLKTRVRRFMVP